MPQRSEINLEIFVYINMYTIQNIEIYSCLMIV